MGAALRKRLSYANVMATIAVFIALGGSSYAALRVGSKQIADNSVRSRDIRDNNVKGKDVRNNSLGGVDVRDRSLTADDLARDSVGAGQIDESALGPVPKAVEADTIDGIDSSQFLRGLPAPEAWHLVGAAGEPPFLNDWANGGGGFAPLRFYKDQLGIVHIQGTIATPGITNHVFTLPPGYRPAFGLRFRTDSCCPAAVYGGSFYVLADGTVTKQQGSYDNVSLDGIAFRAEQ
jgi:hypothetical protein